MWFTLARSFVSHVFEVFTLSKPFDPRRYEQVWFQLNYLDEQGPLNITFHFFVVNG